MFVSIENVPPDRKKKVQRISRLYALHCILLFNFSAFLNSQKHHDPMILFFLSNFNIEKVRQMDENASLLPIQILPICKKFNIY